MKVMTITLTFHFNQPFWFHICIFAETQNQTIKMQKNHQANARRQTRNDNQQSREKRRANR
jgi:hypothetical protein